MRRISKTFLRENILGLSLTLIGILCLVLAAMFYAGHSRYPGFALADKGALDGPDIQVLETQDKGYARIAQTVTPAIVNIQSTHIVRVQMSPFFNDPFFRQFFGDMFGNAIPREQREHALGSGVIVTPDGYILTNNHVIARASEIRVLLPDKRTFKGKVVGADPQTDVAVLKIEAKNLPTVPLGDSSTLKVGATVMAFGNPFGLKFTVTRGSVSALGRSDLDLGRGGQFYEDFIQTDAPINPGNSGGALVNVRAQVVGINTAILSAGSGMGGEGAWNGVGFAIPSNIARHVMESLVKTGKVSRGYLGVSLEELTPDLARHFKVPEGSGGALVSQVQEGTPAEKAGLKPGDVIQTYNGQKVESSNQLRFMVADTPPGTEVTLGILRDGKPETVRLKVEERPANVAEGPGGGGPGGGGGGRGRASQGTLRGISVQTLTPGIRDQLGLPARTRGVVITDIDPNSPAAQAGLQRGDVIESINRHEANSVADFNRLASEARGETLLRVNRGGNASFVVISPSSGGEESNPGNEGDEEQ